MSVSSKSATTRSVASRSVATEDSNHTGIHTEIEDPNPFGRETLLTKPYIKQGHVFCGCCCDARRATIIVDTFNIIIFGYLSWLIYYYNIEISFYLEKSSLIRNEELVNDIQIIILDYGWIVLGFFLLYSSFALVGIIGAFIYNKDMVSATAMWYCFLGICSLFTFSIFGLWIFVAVFLAYPHFVLFQEIAEGIMSEENYPNEMHSCCCVYTSKPRMSIKEAIEKRIGVFA